MCTNRGSSFGVALGYGVRFSARARDFSLLRSVKTGSGAHPASYPKGTGALSPGVKRAGRETDYSFPSSADVKNGRAIPPLPIHQHGMVPN
jgi:hypothetical protein